MISQVKDAQLASELKSFNVLRVERGASEAAFVALAVWCLYFNTIDDRAIDIDSRRILAHQLEPSTGFIAITPGWAAQHQSLHDVELCLALHADQLPVQFFRPQSDLIN